MDNSDAIFDVVMDSVKAQARTLADSAIRYGLDYVGGLIATRTGNSAIPANIWAAVTPIVAELAAATIDGDLTDPDTGRLNPEVRSQFEARLTLTLSEAGLLERL